MHGTTVLYVFLWMCLYVCYIYWMAFWACATLGIVAPMLQTQQNWEPSNSTFVNTLIFFYLLTCSWCMKWSMEDDSQAIWLNDDLYETREFHDKNEQLFFVFFYYGQC